MPIRDLSEDAHVSFLDVSPRARKILKGEGCTTIRDAAALSERELRRLPKVGVGIVAEIKAALASLGLEMAP